MVTHKLLGLVLERSLKKNNHFILARKKIWTPLEMEYDASWSIDRKKNGLRKHFAV